MDDIGKIYWTIGEVATELNVATSKLRFWEEEFDWITIKRNKRGERQYVECSLQQFRNINILSRNGMKLEGIKLAYYNYYYQTLLQLFKTEEIKRNKLNT